MHLLIVLESGLHSLDYAKICQLMKKKKKKSQKELYLVDLNEKLAVKFTKVSNWRYLAQNYGEFEIYFETFGT